MPFWTKIRAVAIAAALVGGAGIPLVLSAAADEKGAAQTEAHQEKAGAQERDKKALLADFNHEKAEEVYRAFNAFCMRHFGAEKEPLIYEKFGRDLRFIHEGSWRHVSENSACIAWETNLPAKSYMEYGETDKYGKKTPEEERHFYLHIHSLKGLETGRSYHYRLVSIDERGNRLVSDDAVLTTGKIDGAIYVPGDLAGPPFNLDKDGVYVLTKDIAADGTAFNFLTDKITLDLNGHTVTYNNVPGVKNLPPGGGEPNPQSARLGAPGIRGRYSLRKKANLRLYNGAIVQGKGNGGFEKAIEDMFCPPVYGGLTEMAGATLSYYGPQVYGVYCYPRPKAESHAHHNVLIDKGIQIINRHSGSRAIGSLDGNLHHNLVKRCRHVALRGVELRSNEVYIDSWATNAYGLWLGNHSIAANNRIFGTGYLLGGIFLSEYKRSGDRTLVVSDKQVYDNLIHLAMMKPDDRSEEYGAKSVGHALRLNYGSGKMEVYGNLIIGSGREGASVKGAWIATNFPVRDTTFRDNVFKIILHGDATGGATRSGAQGGFGCIGLDGLGSDKGNPIVFENNTFISNYNHVHESAPKGGYLPDWAEWKGDGYGNAAVFYGNQFVRVGRREDYSTIHYGSGSNKASWGIRYFDSAFQGGAGYDKAKFIPQNRMEYPRWPRTGETKREFSVGWTLTVRTAPGAKVTVKDRSDKEVFTGAADAAGNVKVRLLQYTLRSVGTGSDTERIPHTPHEVTAEKGGKKAEKTVTMDRQQEVQIAL